MTSEADEKLERAILNRLRDPHNRFVCDSLIHLAKCEQVKVEDPSALDTCCWNSTCDFLELGARLSCPHGHEAEFEYEESGRLSELFAEMDCA